MSNGRFKLRRPKQPSVVLKSAAEVAIMAEAGQLVADSFALLKHAIKPGIRLRELDKMVEDYIRSRGADSLYKGYRGSMSGHPPFPGTICSSINEEICHGLPNDRRLRKGDIVGIDIGLRLKEFCGDACMTFAVGAIEEKAQTLLDVAQESLYAGISAAKIGNRLGDIGMAIQAHAEANGHSVVREWGGHGIGRLLHEPLSIPHTGPGNRGTRIRQGMVFTIEPMINIGAPDCHLLDDGWTVVTNDGKLSAQFEHTVAITRDGPQILSPWHETCDMPIPALKIRN